MNQKTDYSIISRWRNKEQVESLINDLRQRGKSVYSFFEAKDDIAAGFKDPNEFMKHFENLPDWTKHPHTRIAFERDLAGLRNADSVILLLPAGKSAHIEAGIAYGLGKNLILIGEQNEAESLYLIFNEMYNSTEDFLDSL